MLERIAGAPPSAHPRSSPAPPFHADVGIQRRSEAIFEGPPWRGRSGSGDPPAIGRPGTYFDLRQVPSPWENPTAKFRVASRALPCRMQSETVRVNLINPAGRQSHPDEDFLHCNSML